MTPEQQRALEEEQLRQQAIAEAQDYATAEAEAFNKIENAQAQQEQAELDEQARLAQPGIEAALAEPQREEGIVSQVGNVVADIITGDALSNTLNAIAPGIFRSADELDAMERQRVAQLEQGNILQQGVANYMKGGKAAEYGLLATPMMPFSAAAALTGQRQEWNEAPEIVKDSAAAKAIYDITKVAVPTLLTGPVLQGSASVAGLATGTNITVNAGKLMVIESGVETIVNQSPDDYILSRTAAKSVGDIVNMMGGDGGEVTRRLLEGDGIGYRAAGMVAGFFHNLGINKAAGSLFSRLGKIKDPRIDDLAAKSGKSPEEVETIINTTKEPVYKPDTEPIDSVTVDGAANVIAGDQVENVSPMGYLAAIANKGDDLSPNPFFIHLQGLTGGDMGFIRSIKTLTEALPRFKDIARVKAEGSIKALEYLSDNADLFPAPTTDFLVKTADTLLRGVDTTALKAGEINVINQKMLENSAVMPEGIIVSGIAMKELNQRVIALSRQIQTSDTAGIDWSETLPVLRQLMEANETWANIYRHAQQQWHFGGQGLQFNYREAVGKGINLNKYFKKGESIYASPEEMAMMAQSTVDNNKFMTNLIDAAIAGDETALEQVKHVTAIMATESAERPIMASALTSAKFRSNFYSGTGSDLGMAYYGQALLGNYVVATSAVVSTGIRLLTQPALSALGAFPTMLQIAPKRALKLETYLDHLSLYGGMVKGMGPAMRAFRQAIVQNVPVMQGSSRFGGVQQNLAQLAAERKVKFDAYYKQLLAEDKKYSIEAAMATFSYFTRTILTNPFLHGTTRLLMASDEGFKALAGHSYASFKTHRRMLEDATNSLNLREVYDEEVGKIFVDGDAAKGFTMGSEGQEFANAYTFQRDIPRSTVLDENGQVVDAPIVSAGFDDPQQRGINISSLTANTFGLLEDAGKKNALFRYISPFSRIAWEFSNQGTTQLVGTIPGAPIISKLDPGVRAALRGDQGLPAQLMMESNLATGAGALMAFVGLSWAGMITLTGVTKKNGEQGHALVIKPPGTDGIEVNIEKLDPIAFPLGVLASITNQFRDGKISQGRYEQGVIDIFADMSKLFLDKAVLLGLSEFTTLADSRNYNQGWAISAGNLMGTLTGLGTGRMVRDWYDPYRRATRIQDKPFSNFLNAWARRMGTDAIMPMSEPFTNPYTGDIEMRNLTPEDANAEERFGAGMLQMLAGLRMTKRTVDDPIIKEVNKWDAGLNYNFMLKAPGANPFETGQQQAAYTADLYNPQIGNLRGKLKALFASDRYKKAVALYEKSRKKDGPGYGPFPAPEGKTSAGFREIINTMIDEATEAAGKDAVQKGTNGNWYLQNKKEEQEIMQPQALSTGEDAGLYASAAKADTPFARQVRNILDIA